MPGSVASALRRNAVLSAMLSAADGGRSRADVLELSGSEVVHEVGDRVETIVFPADCVLSLAAEDGAVDAAGMVDVAVVGREGVVGLSALLGASVHDTQAVCRVPGYAVRLPASDARRLARDPVVDACLRAYTRAVLASLQQRIVCIRAHSTDQRSACWLLQTHDRVGRDSFELTHTTLATMLGVRRATVSESLAGLQRRGVISSRRGVVSVEDRPVLETLSCSCYDVFRQSFGAALDSTD